MSNITIRHANIDEVETLQNLNDEVFIDNVKYDDDLRMDWAHSEDGGKKYFTDLLNDNESVCLFAEAEGKVIGYIAASPKEIGYRNSKYLEIDNMGVVPEYRSGGIGKQLMDECVRIAKERGFEKVYVNAYFQNTKAIEFYKRNGFSEIDVSLEKKI